MIRISTTAFDQSLRNAAKKAGFDALANKEILTFSDCQRIVYTPEWAVEWNKLTNGQSN